MREGGREGGREGVREGEVLRNYIHILSTYNIYIIV
jgi:hypothetical protein